MSEITKKYTIKPKYKKSALEEQQWGITLSTGKSVIVKVNNLYRWGEFYINLTDKEKDEINSKNEVILNDYDFELIEMWDGGCDFWTEITDDDLYTEEEKDEIDKLLHKWVGEVPEYEDEDDEGFSYEKMEQNGWLEEDCYYVLSGDLEITPSEE